MEEPKKFPVYIKPKTLVIIRGLPGSGKTYLERQIVESLVGSMTVTLCSDRPGNVRAAMSQGFDVVIAKAVFHRNGQLAPFIREAKEFGYVWHCFRRTASPRVCADRNLALVRMPDIMRLNDEFEVFRFGREFIVTDQYCGQAEFQPSGLSVAE